jgi:hypothetical protein
MRAGITVFSEVLIVGGVFISNDSVNNRILMTEQTKMLIMLEVLEKAMVKGVSFILTFHDRLD